MITPFFSIIIPTFNSEEVILECVKSIVLQNFKNFEIIVLDSCSTDRTIDIIEKSFEGQSSIKICVEKDHGIYFAMNKGVSIASGEWIYFLGSDDRLWNENVLGDIHSEIINNSLSGVIYGNVFSTRFNGVYDGKFNYTKLYEKNICHQSIFMNKSVFSKIGFFDTTYKYLSDYEHNIRWFLNKKIQNHYVDIVVAYYADGGVSSLNKDTKFFENIDVIFLKQKNALPRKFKIKLTKKLFEKNPRIIYYVMYKWLFHLDIVLVKLARIKNLMINLKNMNSNCV
jgi:glycosyltransferase involved in cell wall biosynthesis